MVTSAFDDVTHPKQRAFLSAFAKTGVVSRACEIARVGRTNHYRWRSEDPAYQVAFKRAVAMVADLFEDEATRRAIDGVLRPTGWYRGKPGGYVREYSDNLLMFRLKALKPEYRERETVTGSLGAIDLSKLPDHMIERIANGEHPLSVLASGTEEIMARLALPSGSE